MMSYAAEDFLAPSRECDLVMKGGITSGVVYPLALLELARDYRFRSIGGTSAGAIAAGLCAAAEYGRQKSGSGAGYVKLGELVDYLQRHLVDLFQPDPSHRKSFGILLKLIKDRKNPLSGFFSAIRFVPKAIRLVKSLQTLPETYFGLCPGRTQAGYEIEGLTDFLNKLIETLAGRMVNGRLPESPLTFGDLEDSGITLRTVTTSLGTKCPVLLPFTQGGWMAAEDDLHALFPENVTAYLTAELDKASGLCKMPQDRKLPVLFAIRASLSFPVLLAAIPMYRRDYSHRLSEEAREKPRRCWLSDGGITSNFPIHLFDSPFPTRPTFGLSLDEYSATKHHADPDNLEGRVYCPAKARQGIQRPVSEISGVGGFLAAILDTARNWQDSLQTVMPGYRERIVHIALTKEEGGLNLEMEPQVVKRLTDLGKIAGSELGSFDLREHQWRRLLATYTALEVAFGDLVPKLPKFKASLADHAPMSYKPASDEELEDLWGRLEALVAAAEPLASNPVRETWGTSDNMPSPGSYVKLVPKEQAGRN